MARTITAVMNGCCTGERLDRLDVSSAMSDEGLVVGARRGDDKAFEELVRRHKDAVIRLAVRMFRNAAEADDAAQEAFIRAYQGLSRLDNPAVFKSWLLRIASHVCLDRLRKRKRMVVVAVDDMEDNLLDERSDHDREVREMRERLDQALDRLSPADKLVIIQLELEEKSVREVAEITGWSEVNVKVRAFRARRKLRAFLEESNG